MSEPARTRPSQVTLASWVIMVASAFVVVTAFDTIAGLRSLETREAIETVLAQPPYPSLGLDVAMVRRLIHLATMVAAGCATAALLLGWQLRRRDRVARIALSCLAAPLFVAGLATAPFYASVVAVAVVMLWIQPAHGWFSEG